MFSQINGSITEVPGGSIIVHQVNCQSKMGAGVAKVIADRYPEVKKQYHTYCQQHTPVGLLGKVQYVKVEDGITVANMFGQLTYGRTGQHTDYKAVGHGLREIAKHARCNGIDDIYLPYRMGCNLGGGDWRIVRSIIKQIAKDYPDLNFYAVSDKPLDLSCGITERGDAGVDLSWEYNLKENINIIISKKLTDELIEALIRNKDRVIFHHTVTGYGGRITEPNVPKVEWSFSQAKKLFEKGFPMEQYVLRVDPIIPTEIGIKRAMNVINNWIKFGCIRVRYSFIDTYNHVRERFSKVGLEFPWEGFTAPKSMQDDFLLAIKSVSIDYYKSAWVHNPDNGACFESCAEYTEHKLGCISNRDYEILCLPEPVAGASQQRKSCSCIGTKTELLTQPKQCANGCLYCYWK